MLGDPIAFIAQRLGMPGEIGSVGEGLRDRAGIGDGHEVEEREFRHATDMRWGRPWFNHPTSSFPRTRDSSFSRRRRNKLEPRLRVDDETEKLRTTLLWRFHQPIAGDRMDMRY